MDAMLPGEWRSTGGALSWPLQMTWRPHSETARKMAVKDELAELCQFLNADNAQLRVQAAEIVQGLTGSETGAAEVRVTCPASLVWRCSDSVASLLTVPTRWSRRCCASSRGPDRRRWWERPA